MSNSTHPSNLDTIKEVLDQMDQEYNATYRTPDAIAALVKTIKSFNITITDWNTLVDYISVLGSTMRALVKAVPEIAGLIAPMYGYVDLESDQNIEGCKIFKDGIKIDTAPTYDADATTKLYVDNNIQNVREVAEGKCKTIVIDYAITVSENGYDSAPVKTETGETLDTYQDFLEYVGNRTCGNSLFNDQANTISMDFYTNYYLVEMDPGTGTKIIYKDFEHFHTGDIVLIPELNVPDRWMQIYKGSVWFSIAFHTLEISKIDIQHIPDNAYVTASNKPSGLSYGLRIRNNGWTSDIQQEGGASLKLQSTSLETPSNFVLKSESGDSPSLIFQRGTLTDSSYDWKITDINGELVLTQLTGLDTQRFKFNATSFTPMASATYDLGASGASWKDIYLSGSMKIANHDSGIYCTDANKYLIRYDKNNGFADTEFNFCPISNNSNLSLGTNFRYWKDLYLSGQINLKGNSHTWNILADSTYDELRIRYDDTNRFTLNSSAIMPNWNQTLGTDAYPWKTLSLGKVGVAGEGKITFVNPDLNNQGNWYITSQDQSGLSIMQDTQNTGVKISRGSVYPLTTGYFELGSASYRWKTLHLSHYVSWGNNVLIGKDSSNRFYVSDSNGNTKIKVGVNETYFANHVEPDANNTYDLGRTNVAWRDLYLAGNLKSADGTTSISISDIATKNELLNVPAGTSQGEILVADGNDKVAGSSVLISDVAKKGSTVFATGTFDNNGEGTINMENEGTPEGIFMFTYANAQTMVYLSYEMLDNASLFPIRVPCPVLRMVGGTVVDGVMSGGSIEGNSGNLKISRAGDILTLKVASTVNGSTNLVGYSWKLIRTNLA